MNPPDLTFSIVNVNNCDLLAQCLRSIYATTHDTRFEVIVVDNGSTDDSVAMTRAGFPEVDIISIDETTGYSAAHNRALRKSRGRYVLVMNEDVLVLPGAIDHMVAFMDATPTAGMLGCRLLNPDGTLQPSCRTFPNLSLMLFRALYLDKLLPRNRWTGANFLSYWQHNTTREVDVIMGSFMLVRREVLQQVGLMDEQFRLYSEETDWCYRTKRQGWKILFTPGAQVIHYGGQTTSRHAVRTTTIHYESLLKYFRKHHGPVGQAVVRLLAVVEIALRLVYWSLSYLVRPPRRAYATRKIGLYRPALRWLLTGIEPSPSSRDSR